ncbi:MAG: hypothetical protein P1P64_08345 [Treponemataceae bacterium]
MDRFMSSKDIFDNDNNDKIDNNRDNTYKNSELISTEFSEVVDEFYAEMFPEINESFEKMQEIQAKDISARIVRAEEKLNKIEAELVEFLKA